MNEMNFNYLPRLLPIHHYIGALINHGCGDLECALVVEEVPLPCYRVFGLCCVVTATCKTVVIHSSEQLVGVAETRLGARGMKGGGKGRL